MADKTNVACPIGAKLTAVKMPRDTVICTTEKMIQILHHDPTGMIREWRFELMDDGLVLFDPLHDLGTGDVV